MGRRKVHQPSRDQRKYWKERRHLLTEDDFRRDTRQIFDLDALMVKTYNNNFASIKNRFLINSPNYPEIKRLRAIENSSDGDKKALAKLIDQTLIDEINLQRDFLGLPEEIGAKTLNGVMTKLSLELNENDLTLQGIEPTRELLILRATLYMEDHYPIYNWLINIPGMGEKTCAKLLSIIGDIRKFQKPSQLLSYLGMGDPETCKLRKGVQARFKPEGKALVLGIIADNLVKQSSLYKRVYNERKAKTEISKPEWTKNHRHIDAKRVMSKRFICELYDAWYRSLGMEPPAKPYGTEIMGHHIEPQIYPYKY
jgi:hypothetical protein